MAPERAYPDWLEFQSRTIGGPVASVRSRSGIVRVEIGEGETADRVLLGIPDDGAWSTFAATLDAAGFWAWPAETEHREPHRAGDWYWWLEVRAEERKHRAAAWNGAPADFERVRGALFELVEQVLADVPADSPSSDEGRAQTSKRAEQSGNVTSGWASGRRQARQPSIAARSLSVAVRPKMTRTLPRRETSSGAIPVAALPACSCSTKKAASSSEGRYAIEV
jgi:hypothetical protein